MVHNRLVELGPVDTRRRRDSCRSGVHDRAVAESSNAAMSLQIPYEAFNAGIGDQRIVTTLCPGGKERMRRLMEVVRHGRVDLTALLRIPSNSKISAMPISFLECLRTSTVCIGD